MEFEGESLIVCLVIRDSKELEVTLWKKGRVILELSQVSKSEDIPRILVTGS